MLFYVYVELNNKVKELERSKRLAVKDKEYMEKEVTDLRDKLSSIQKEFREMKGQKKQNMDEFSDLNDRLADVRSQKMKLSRLVREKEEEIESAMKKLETLRQDFRASEKKKHDLAAQLEEVQADLHKEVKLKAKADLYCQQLEEELDSIKLKKTLPATSIQKQSDTAEVSKVKSEMEKLKVVHEESLSREKKRMALDNKVEIERMNA